MKNTDIKFDYDADTPDEKIRAVVAEISGTPLKPLSEYERLQRQLWRDEQAFLAEQRRAERERLEAQRAEAERAEAAIERAEANRKARIERAAEIERQTREIELRDLQSRVRSHQAWQSGVQNAVRKNIADQYRNTLMGELDAMINPPPPPPPEEPIVVVADDRLGSPNYFDDNYNPNYYHDKFWGKSAK